MRSLFAMHSLVRRKWKYRSSTDFFPKKNAKSLEVHGKSSSSLFDLKKVRGRISRSPKTKVLWDKFLSRLAFNRQNFNSKGDEAIASFEFEFQSIN